MLLRLILQRLVDAVGLSLGDQINEQPYQCVARDKKRSEVTDASGTAGNPVVKQIHEKVIQIQHTAMERDG